MFQGLVFSKGQFNSPNCVYVKPYTGSSTYSFDIYYNKCGTKPDLNGKFYENTIIVQYDNELIEVRSLAGTRLSSLPWFCYSFLANLVGRRVSLTAH